MTPTDFASWLPMLGPLLAGDGFWRVVTVLVLVGLPMREEHRGKDGAVTQRWRWRGVLVIGWEWAHGRRIEGEAFARLVRRLDRLVPLLEAKLGGELRTDSEPPPATVRAPHRPTLTSRPSDDPLEGG
jgi:hypothetical protein